jgi:hypothetical protein
MILAGLAGYAWLHYSPMGAVLGSAEAIELPYRLRNGAEHDAARSKNGGNPYILEFEVPNGGSLIYYGASHVSDPKHPQVNDIEGHWERFQPTIALCEGRSRGFFYGGLIEPFAGLPEPALVHKLARRDGVPLASLEPSYEAEVRELLRSFTAEQVALYFFLRVYSSEAGGAAREDLAVDLLQKRTNVEGLRGVYPDLHSLDRVWERDFKDEANWRTLQAEPGYLARISDTSRRLRGEHMARNLVKLVNNGERVFAVVGSGHVIRQEWNLRALLGQGPAWDQPVLEANRVEVME